MVDATATIEGDGGNALVQSALADKLAHELGSFLVGTELTGGTELGIKGRAGADGLRIDIIDDLRIDVCVSAVHGETGTLSGTGDFATDATLAALEPELLRLLLVHADLLLLSRRHLTG